MELRQRNRPQKFSDPNLEYSQEEARQILEKDDRQLAFLEFSMIFSENLPIGEYEECAYFVPVVIDFVLRADSRTDGLPDVIDNFLGWSRRNLQCLEKDGYAEYIISVFQERLRTILADFRLEKGPDGRLWPEHMNEVESIVTGLNKLISGRDLADEVLKRVLGNVTDVVSASWTVFLSCFYRWNKDSPVPFVSGYLESIYADRAKMRECVCTIISRGGHSQEENELFSLWERGVLLVKMACGKNCPCNLSTDLSAAREVLKQQV